MTTRDADSLMTVAKCADVLGVSEITIRRRVADGSLRSLRVGRGPGATIRIDPADLTKFVVECTQKPRD